MSLEQDIIRILAEYTDTLFGGNKDRAARSLGVQPPTFWRWLNGKNIPKMESLVQPFNILKAKILLPSDVSTETNQLQDIYKRNLELEKENIELKAQVEELKAYRIKWEGHLESLRAQSGVDTQKLPEKNKLAS
ncbi:hypothetical protein [Bilophila wadsworthia]|jgi:transcriptional regulator with XRE-family HTH domain|uniref:hypothetical protein n=1 Tax=Bilophila wadsworthia TaxID=35833 RepID=UPI00242DA875|nr:hypothetical protein [Bilophila wadsworthia]